MFITIGTATQHVSDAAGKVLLATPEARIATAHEAAHLVSLLVMRGASAMHAANDEFNATFGRK